MGGSGFVLIEAAATKIPLISSNCKNGPKSSLIMIKEVIYIKIIVLKVSRKNFWSL